jgi:PPP family 3-phenylpropionic acid transporter
MFGWDIMFGTYVGLASIAIMVGFNVEDSYSKSRSGSQDRDINPLILFKNGEYIFLIIFASFLFIPSMAIIHFLPAIVKSVGGTAADQGTALFANAISEMPILFLAEYFIKRFKIKVLLLTSAIFFVIRMGVFLAASSPALVIVGCLLRSLSFGIFLPTARHYISEIAPANLKTTAQTVATAIYMGIGSILADLFAGRIIDQFGVETLLLICISLSSCAVVLMAGRLFIFPKISSSN